MNLLTIILVSFVALEHIYFLVLEMFFWTKPKGIKAFGFKSKEFAEETKVLYNRFLAAGLLFSIIRNDIKTFVFLLVCVTIADIYGSYSTKQIKFFSFRVSLHE